MIINDERSVTFLFSATNKKYVGFLVREYEKKVSLFYGCEMEVVAIAMECWLCANVRDIDNVNIYWEPVKTTN